MNVRALGTGIVIMLAIAAGGVAIDFWKASRMPAGFYIDTGDPLRLEIGRNLYAMHCAACHGAQLQGQPDWRMRYDNGRLPAPPHDETGHTWHHPDAVLFDITRNGMVPGRTAPEGYESDMPAYAGILADEEIMAVLAYIKSTWPGEIRELHDEVNRNAWQGGAR